MKWAHHPNLRKRPRTPAKGRGPVQRAIKRVFAATSASALVLMRRLGADCSVVVMKRGNARGAKGAGHRHLLGSTGNGRNPMFKWKAAGAGGGLLGWRRRRQNSA